MRNHSKTTTRHMFYSAACAAGLLTAAAMLFSTAAQAAPYASAAHQYSASRHTPVYSYEAESTADYLAPLLDNSTVSTIINPANIRYMSGGIGREEQERFEAARHDFPVRLVFANSHGAYISSVDVTVADAQGDTLLQLHTDGPILLLGLEQGRYTVTARSNGQEMAQTLTVSTTPRSYTMHFKTDASRDYSLANE